jgi:3'-phosphoadenosine 5'-phosphosulfate sulfotransferase (PAPS reductase)/FAD synthetase
MITTALAFSGGKDSWACLWLNKDKLADIVVVWANTGKNHPELLATIAKAKALCPNFTELRVDRDAQNAEHGLPADVVPINWTVAGQMVTGVKPVKVQSYIQCCYENIAEPINAFCRGNGITHIITGQRNDEGYKSSSRNGDTADGIIRIHPIEDWTAEQVLGFVGQHMGSPDHFKFKHSSMDCFDCTAYRKESQDRIQHMAENEPELYTAYAVRKGQLHDALTEALELIL